jgi:hypothetical protein
MMFVCTCWSKLWKVKYNARNEQYEILNLIEVVEV